MALTADSRKSSATVASGQASRRRQTVNVGGRAFEFAAGETIHTENSYKYSPDEFINLANAGGFKHQKIWSDNNDFFSIYFLEAY